MNSSDQEKDCGVVHLSIVDAIRHAEENLHCRGLPMQLYWGTTRENLGLAVGFQMSSRKRWRLDYDNAKGVHINEENFEVPKSEQKTVQRVRGVGTWTGDLQVRLLWQKWTSGAVDTPDKVKEELRLLNLRGKGRL